MKLKNIFSTLIIYFLVFVGMTSIKADWVHPEKYDCQSESFYYNYNSSTLRNQDDEIVVKTCSAWRSELSTWGFNSSQLDAESQRCNAACPNGTLCVRVGEPCRYRITNQTTSSKQAVFCLDGLTHLQDDSDVRYVVSGNLQTNKGMACALVDIYREYANANRLDEIPFTNNILTLDTIVNSNTDTAKNLIDTIQKKIWSHQYDDATCDPIVNVTTNQGNVHLNTESNNLSYNSTSQNFTSGRIEVTADSLKAGTSISLSLSNAPTGAFISTNKNATSSSSSVTSVSSGTAVYIIIPKASMTSTNNVKLTASAQVLTQKSWQLDATFQRLVYDSSSSSATISQDLGIPVLTRTDGSTYSSKSANATFELQYGNIVITKKDVKNGFTLSGAKFTLTINGNAVRDIYGNVVGEKTSDENGKVTFENIPHGTYLITETNSPTGYQITTASQSKTLNSSSLAFDWTNAPRSILISKKDITSEDEVLGAHIQVYKYNESARTKGTLYDEFDSNTIAHSKNYEAGNYVMIETLPAPKYKKVQTAFVFSVSEEGKATLKAVGTFGDDNKFTAITDTTKKKDAEKFIKIENDNSITLYNELMLVKISKKDITGAKELAGAKIKITNDKDPNFKIEFESKKEEETKVNLEYLEPQGTKKYYYYMEETIAPKGYKKITTVFKFSVDEEGVPKLVSIGSWDKNGKFTNEKKVSTNENIKFKDDTITLLDEPIKIKFAKKDSSTSEYIKGAKITITPESKTGKVITFETTSSDYELDLEPGIYYIRETAAPEGYQELDIEYKIEITEEKNIKLLSENADNISIKDNYIILYNTLVPVESTGVSISPLIFAGVGLLIVAGIILIIAVKKRRS